MTGGHSRGGGEAHTEVIGAISKRVHDNIRVSEEGMELPYGLSSEFIHTSSM